MRFLQRSGRRILNDSSQTIAGLCFSERSFNRLAHIALEFRIPVSDAG